MMKKISNRSILKSEPTSDSVLEKLHMLEFAVLGVGVSGGFTEDDKAAFQTAVSDIIEDLEYVLEEKGR